jgi:hypothetical protein
MANVRPPTPAPTPIPALAPVLRPLFNGNDVCDVEPVRAVDMLSTLGSPLLGLSTISVIALPLLSLMACTIVVIVTSTIWPHSAINTTGDWNVSGKFPNKDALISYSVTVFDIGIACVGRATGNRTKTW